VQITGKPDPLSESFRTRGLNVTEFQMSRHRAIGGIKVSTDLSLKKMKKNHKRRLLTPRQDEIKTITFPEISPEILATRWRFLLDGKKEKNTTGRNING